MADVAISLSSGCDAAVIPNAERIKGELSTEEEKFRANLDRGEKMLEDLLQVRELLKAPACCQAGFGQIATACMPDRCDLGSVVLSIGHVQPWLHNSSQSAAGGTGCKGSAAGVCKLRQWGWGCRCCFGMCMAHVITSRCQAAAAGLQNMLFSWP